MIAEVKNYKNKDVVSQMQSKWEEKRKHLLVQMKMDEVQKRFVRTKRCLMLMVEWK